MNSIIYRSRPPNFDKLPTARKSCYEIYPYDECTNTLARCWRAARFPYRCTQLQRTERSRSPREYFKRSCRAGTRDSRSKKWKRADVRSFVASSPGNRRFSCNATRLSPPNEQIKKHYGRVAPYSRGRCLTTAARELV